MVSGEKVWDPLHAGFLPSRLSEQHRATRLTHIGTEDTDVHQRLSSTPPPPPQTVVVPDVHPAQASSCGLLGLSHLLDSFDTTRCSPSGTGRLYKPSCGLGVGARPVSEEGGGEAEQRDMKGKSRQGGRAEALLDDRLEDMADGPKNAKITLSFPLSAAPLPATLTSPNHCRTSSTSCPSPHRRRPSSSGSKGSDEGSLWKLDATMDVKHRPFKPPRHDSSPSSSPSSSSSPMTVNTLARRDIKSPPPLKCSPKVSPENQFNRLVSRSSNGPTGGCYTGDGWDERHRAANGTVSPSQTAQILFNLGNAAYPGQRSGDAERKDKMTGGPGVKVGSPHRLKLHPPTLHLPPPQPPPPPPPSDALTDPPHSSSFPPGSDGVKAELICGVCHRLFSSASSLTVHMRLHRGSRALSCRYCGKAFIHSKRLQSHEAACGAPALASSSLGPPSLTVQPKEEPLEEGEVRVEGGVIVAAGGVIDSKARPGKKARSILARIQGDDAAAAELLGGDENHFVKVVDGNVIYFCSVCERSYMTLSSLKRHSNVHSWRRKYPCHFCDKVFALAEYRTKHEVWHTGERRYQCIFCWDAFATYYNLKTHQKTIHGINPGLISSEKTANGGYKQKVNALKLYRLLPMRSQKRPYKTYSDGLPNGLLLPPPDPTDSIPLSLGLDCGLGTGDLQSLISGALPQSMKPDPDAFLDGFPVSLDVEHRDLSTLAPLPQTDTPEVRKHERDAPELEQVRREGSFKMSSSSKTKSPKSSRVTEAGVSSVITYGHTKPSVIVHGKALSSSVIVHSNQVASGSDKSSVNSPSPETSDSQTSHSSTPRLNRKQRESTESHRKRSRDSSDTTEEGQRGRQDAETGRSHHKLRRSHSKSDMSTAKQLSASGGSQVKGTGPLCQITVRIGEEAMVKRSISETDLRRDKSHSPPKGKRSEVTSPPDAKEPRHTHSHHHHHKHRAHRSASLGAEKEQEGGGGSGGEVRKKTSKCPDKVSEVREYYFRQEVRQQGESDHDAEDLWLPYYAYKPKRKAQAHFQRAKNWQRKLQYKRSLRLMRRAERLMNHVSKETEKRQGEEEDGKGDEVGGEEVEGEKEEVEEAEDKTKLQVEKEDRKSTDYVTVPSRATSKDACEASTEAAHSKASTPPLCSPKPPPSTSATPGGIKRRPWTSGNAAECGTCGRWFSSPRKRDKHELSHLLEFVCLFCRATFPSREKLEDHQRAQHPKPPEAVSLPPKMALNEPGDGFGAGAGGAETSREDEERAGRVARATSSPSRLSRRALARHTCPQCHKVCKTSSALTRHTRRHELSSSPEREREEVESQPKYAESVVDSVSKDPDIEKDQAPTAAQSVSVISFSTTEPPCGDDRLETQQCDNPPIQLREEFCDKTEQPELKTTGPEREPSPQIMVKPLLDSPVNLTPTKPEFTPPAPTSTSTLQSVLVMSGSECLDYRTHRKKSLDSQIHRIPSPAHVMAPVITSPNMPMTSQTRITTAAPVVSMTTVPSTEVGIMKREGVIMDRDRQVGNGTFLPVGYEEPPFVQDLRVPSSLPRSPSPTEAQDLTMSSILAREKEMQMQRQREKEREIERQREREKELEREREREKVEAAQQMSSAAHPRQEEVTLLVPKEEPLSPVPSPSTSPFKPLLLMDPHRPGPLPNHPASAPQPWTS